MTRAISPNIVRGRLSEAERSEIERLSESGLSSGQIARRLNRHPGTIGFFMASRGLRNVRPAPVEAVKIMRRGTSVWRFTREEDAFITALRVQGFTCQRIAEIAAKRFGRERSGATIGIRLKMIASQD